MNKAALKSRPSPLGHDIRQTLLVVEEDVLARSAVCDTLQDAGYTALEAGTANKAVAILRTVAVDLLFVDVHVDGKYDGLSVVRLARRQRPWVKLMFTSNRISPSATLRLDSLGPFVAKPYEFSRVMPLIRLTLARDQPAT